MTCQRFVITALAGLNLDFSFLLDPTLIRPTAIKFLILVLEQCNNVSRWFSHTPSIGTCKAKFANLL